MLIPYGEWEEILAGSSYVGVTRDYPSIIYTFKNINILNNMIKLTINIKVSI
jgi:hypothetical protein